MKLQTFWNLALMAVVSSIFQSR